MKIALYVFTCTILWSQANAILTNHFVYWLVNNGYGEHKFQREDVKEDLLQLQTGSFGGKAGDNDVVNNQPVIFFHGNTGEAGIYKKIVDYFKKNGYKDSELYATTWGVPGIQNFNKNAHRKEFVVRVRKFIEAVLDYTGAEKVDVIAHSMGVTLSRAAIKGGKFVENGATYDLGAPLTQKIDTFVGVAGVNQGHKSCADFVSAIRGSQFCNRETGFYPGDLVGLKVVDKSLFLENLNQNPGFEGEYRYSIITLNENAITNNGVVYNKFTSHVPNSTDDFVFNDPKYNHVTILTETADLQFDLVRNHGKA